MDSGLTATSAPTAMDIALTLRPPSGPAPSAAGTEIDALATLLQQACQPTPPSPADARALAVLGQGHWVAAGRSPFDETAPSHAMWLVARGCVTMGGAGSEGHRQPLRSFQHGQWLDVANAWLGLAVVERCVADVDSTLYAFPIAEVEALCRRRPSVARVLLSLLARHVRESTRNAQQLLTKDALARCATWLLDALPATADGTTVVLAQRKSTVASQIGTSPETFSRTLRRLREMGAIDVKGARIFVRDATTLHRLAMP
jgi:CRP-like cAMP-binding protein